MRSEKITFRNRQGIDLAARFDRPDDKPVAYALAAHCFTCTKDIPAMHRISMALVERKIGVLRFDFTGLGHSGGEFANSGFKANLDDIRAAVAYLKEREAAPQILFGHSLGGTAVLATAQEVETAVLIATLGSPYQPTHASHFFADALRELETCGVATLTLANSGGLSKKKARDFSSVVLCQILWRIDQDKGATIFASSSPAPTGRQSRALRSP